MGVTVREKPPGSGIYYVFVHHNSRTTSKKIGPKKVAHEVADKLRAKLALGLETFEQNKPVPVFSDYANDWLNGYVKNKLKPSTFRSYKSILSNHLLPDLKHTPIDKITRDTIKGILTAKSATLSGNRVKRIQSCISSIMTMAIEDGIITANPASGLQKYVGGRTTVDIPDPYDAYDLNNYLKTCLDRFPSYYPFFLTLARTGLRLGECLALKWGDLDFNRSFIAVRRSITDGIEDVPKSGRGRRVPMTPMVSATLKNLRTYRKNQTIKNGWRTVPEYIFVGETGKPYHPGNLSRRVHDKITEYAGIRRIRFHDFRHTYATLRVAKGDAIQNVSKALGHSSIRITIDTYYMYLPATDQDAVDELDTIGALAGKNAKEA